MLGVHTDSATVVYEEGIQLINLPLRITDDKKNPYSVSSYQLMYKQAGVTEEERGDKTVVVPATRSLVQLFRETPSPASGKDHLRTTQTRRRALFLRHYCKG